LRYDIGFELFYFFYKVIFRDDLLEAWSHSRISSKKLTEFDIWLCLRSVYKYFRTVKPGFNYKTEFKIPKAYSLDEIHIHLLSMYEEFTDTIVDPNHMHLCDNCRRDYEAYLRAFIRSLGSLDFGISFNVLVEESAETANTIDHSGLGPNKVGFFLISSTDGHDVN